MKLVEVPDHEFMESPSSWLSRVALRQVVSPQELALHLDLKIRIDFEMSLARASFEDLITKVAKASTTSRMVDAVMYRLRKIDPNGERYLLRHRSVAYHRFCAACLATDMTKYFRLEWRFKCWRWCPVHYCLLRESCPHCNRVVVLPGDMYNAGLDGFGIATLDRCLHCADLLTTGWENYVDSLCDDVTTSWEKVLLRNGRSVLAALLSGHLCVQDEVGTFQLTRLKKIERQGYLPHVNFRLTHEELVRRQNDESVVPTGNGDRQSAYAQTSNLSL